MTFTDQQLVDDICTNDPRKVNAATRQLTRRAKAIAMRYVLSNSGNQADAEDIVQETVLAAWKQICSGAYQVRPESPLDAYLYRIVRNKWLKKIGKRPPEDGELHDAMAEEQPEEHYLKEYFASAIAQLGNACQEVITLIFYEGFSYEEIADKLNASIDAIKMRKFRCQMRLGTLLQEILGKTN